MARTKKNEVVAVEETKEVTEVKAVKTKKSKKTFEEGKRRAYYLTVRVTFTQPLLATNANDAEIYSRYLASLTDEEKRKEEIERLGLTEVDEKGMTVFLRNPENPMIPQLKGYTWLGFLKDKARALAKVDGSFCSTMTAYIKEIDQRISVSPAYIDLELPEGTGIDTLQRPLRAQTMQGERVSLAKSEVAPIGSECEFTFRCETKEGMQMILDCLEYGEIHGTGQWRNAGNGTFETEIIDQRVEIVKSKFTSVLDKFTELEKELDEG